MNEFSQLPAPTSVITSVTRESIGQAFGVTGWTTANWPTSNKSLLTPFVIYQPFTVRILFTFNGNPLSGNMQMGIYDQGRNLRVSGPITAQAGINRPQSFRVPDTLLQPGSYWIAMAMDNTTGSVFRRAAGIGDQALGYGIAQVLNNFPLQQNIDGQISRLSTATIAFMGCGNRTFV